MEWAQKDLCVVIEDSLSLKNVSTANALYAPVQAMILTDILRGGEKKNGKTLDRWSYNCLNSFAPHRWQFKMFQVLLRQPGLVIYWKRKKTDRDSNTDMS